LVNAFLDQLLFNFLSTARSTSLSSLRPAVTEVLKPKLAREAIEGADQELHEYLGGGEEEELLAFHGGQDHGEDWDLELVWKRTRLRCMVYSSLGDMEEEDEDMYTEQEHLESPASPQHRGNCGSGTVSPAVAIFLTSILEYIGEAALVVAGQAAHYRLRLKTDREQRAGTYEHEHVEIADRVVVEELDTEKVALDRSLGRLWRIWRKRVRSPSHSVSTFSRDLAFRQGQFRAAPDSSRKNSVATEETQVADVGNSHTSEYEAALAVPLPTSPSPFELAVNVPLPMNKNDVNEIEIPGLDLYRDTEDANVPKRPKSLILFPTAVADLPTPSNSRSSTPTLKIITGRKRSRSLPSPGPSPFASPVTVVHAEADYDQVKVNSEGGDASEDKPADQSSTGATLTERSNEEAKDVKTKDMNADESEIDDDVEEAQIMTSRRISLDGSRHSPDIVQNTSRSSSRRSLSGSDRRRLRISQESSTFGPRSHSPGPQPGSLQRTGSVQSTTEPITEDEEDSTAIGVAHTSNASIPIASPRSGMGGVGKSHSQSNASVDESQHIVEIAEEKQQSLFVLSPPPAPRSARHQDSAMRASPSSIPAAASPPASDSLFPTTSRTPGVENGVPPLTPLREMMEHAEGTSDDASSTTPSHEALRSEQGFEGSSVNGHAAQNSISSIHSLNKYISDTSKRSPTDRRGPLAYSGVVDRATVQLVTPMTPTLRDDTTPKPRSDSLSKHQRSIHTSGSLSSQKSYKIKPVRTSEDEGGSVTSEKHSQTTEDKGRSFEKLIQSDQTIQYTLTPATMRDIEVK
jgi:hypothetical protein